MRVGRDIHLQVLHHLRGDPARAQLQAREDLLVQDQHSAPPWRSLRAAEEPAGPPPMISTSLWITRGLSAQRLDTDDRGSAATLLFSRGREQHLEQLQRAGREGRDRTRQVQPPHAHELLIEHAAHAIHVALEQRQPVGAASARSAAAGSRRPAPTGPRARRSASSRSGRRTGARENALLDPRMQLRRIIAADAMDQAAAVGAAAQRCATLPELPVVLDADMLEHAHGDEGVVSGRRCCGSRPRRTRSATPGPAALA